MEGNRIKVKVSMTLLFINNRPVEAQLIEVPQGSETPPPIVSSYNLPFHDEICLRFPPLDPSGPPRFYVARLHSKTDLSSLGSGSTIELGDGTNSTNRLTGEVVWLEDESPTAFYPLSKLEINFGYVTEGGSPVFANAKKLGFDPKKLKQKILESLGIKPGDLISEERFGQILAKIDRLKTVFDDEIVDTYASLSWDGKNGLQLKLLLAPPAKTLATLVSIDSGLELSAKEKTAILAKTASFFKLPLTREAIADGMKKLTDYFKESPDYFIAEKNGRKKTGFGYTKEGGLNLHLVLQRVPKSLSAELIELDRNSKVVWQFKFSADSGAPVHFRIPFSEANMEKNLEDLTEHYGKKGFLATVTAGPISAGSVEYKIILQPAPTGLSFEGNMGPSAEELRKMFAAGGYFSTLSIRNGRETLAKWYRDRGYLVIKSGEPKIEMRGEKLVVTAHPAKLKGLSVYYISKGKDGKGKKVAMDLKHNAMKEFEQTTAGDIFDIRALRRAMGRINTGYPFQAEYSLKPDPETNSVAVTVDVYDVSPAFKFRLGGGGTKVGDSDWGGNFSVGGSLLMRSGSRPGLDFGYLKVGDDQVANIGASLYVPWITDRGTSVTVGAYGTIVIEGTAYNHIVGAYGELGIPIRRHSPWGIIAGLRVDTSISPANGYKSTWFRPDVGIRYATPQAMARLATGPRVSDDGGFFWEAAVKALRSFPLTENWHFDLQGSAGARMGNVPNDQLFRGFELPANYEGFPLYPGNVHAGGRADVKYRLATLFGSPVEVGVGISARFINTPFGLNPAFGAGLSAQLLGMELLLGPQFSVTPDGIPGGRRLQINPFGFTFGYSR